VQAALRRFGVDEVITGLAGTGVVGVIHGQNKAVVYDILFKAAAETVRTIAADPRHLGAETGMIAVLHTWGQNLFHHPHVHCIVPGGGLAPDGRYTTWKYGTGSNSACRSASHWARARLWHFGHWRSRDPPNITPATYKVVRRRNRCNE